MRWIAVAVAGLMMSGQGAGRAAETCTTQAQMQAPERDALAEAARGLAVKVEAGDEAGIKALTIADFQKDFSGIADVIASTAPKLKGTAAEVEQVYMLDASSIAKTAAGGNGDAAFFCSLNKSQNEAEFTIPQLPSGKYGFAMVRMEGTGVAPYRLSFLLRQEGGKWLLAGLYPKELVAGGHDGLWYWKEARALNTGAKKESWNSWLYYQQAQALLSPANFVSSTHLDKLQTELAAAAPPAVASGISVDAPLVVKGADGTEYRFTALTVDDSLQKEKVDVAAHLKEESLGDAVAARKRNDAATAALVEAHPELRKAFHGVWMVTDVPGQSPYATEQAMSDIR